MSLLISIFKIPVLGNICKRIILQFEGGYTTSKTMRKFFKQTYNVEIGFYSYGGCFLPEFNLGGTVTIGRYCSFATNVRYFGANHPLNRVSMSPYFYNKDFNPNAEDVERSNLIIGNDCWIGYGVIITSKCKRIGNGSVIGAGSVVTKDVPPYAIVAGNPAKIIKYRFDDKTISLIEKSKWWEKEPEYLLKHADSMNDVESFIKENYQ